MLSFRRALLLSLICSLPAALVHAADATPAPQPAKAEPAVKATPPSVVLPSTKTTSAADSSEPDLKVTKNSGGKSTSSLITNAPLKSDHVMGNPKAPIIMVEYASLSCPHCAHFSGAVLPVLQKKYIDTGKMAYILRQFPLNEPALKGAMLLDCVGEQSSEKYYVFSRVLFDAQKKWAFDGDYMAGLETIALVGGLSREQFQNCLNNTDREMRVLKVKKSATDELHLPHTPYFFIAGEVYDGDRSPAEISKFIDAKLAAIKTH